VRGSLSGIVLAAGASTRMGRPKQLLPLAGRPLLQHVIGAALESRLDEIVVVLGHAAEEIRAALDLPSGDRVRIVVNAEHAAGQSTSLRAGLRAAASSAAGAAILLGDQPDVGAVLIDRVAEAFLAGDRPAARPVFRSGDGRSVPGHPVFLARSLWAEIETLRGDEGARNLFVGHPERLLEVPIEGEAPADIDTPADHEGVKRSRRTHA
jgi:molybdenum cofactor cytidylyltransferase